MTNFKTPVNTTWSMNVTVDGGTYSIRWVVVGPDQYGNKSAALKVFQNDKEITAREMNPMRDILVNVTRYLRLEQLKTEYVSDDLDKLIDGTFQKETILSLIERSSKLEYLGQSDEEYYLTVQDVAKFFSTRADVIHDELDALSKETGAFIINWDDNIFPVAQSSIPHIV